MKNGRAGTVVGVDLRRRSLAVAFEAEGTIVVPATYLDEGCLEYGYARTTYGVEGATLERAQYHASDASSFEEGYVALTRGRSTTRIYLVDSATPGDEDAGHRAHDQAPTGLDTVSEAMERRRARELASDRDPLAARVHHDFAGLSRAQLRTERERLEAVLAQCPKDVRGALAALVRRRDALLASKRATEAGAEPSVERTSQRRTRRDHGPLAGDQLHYIGRTLETVTARISVLQTQDDLREAFLIKHRDDVDRLRSVRSAEDGVDLRASVLERLGPAADTYTNPSQLLRQDPSLPAVGRADHGLPDLP